MHGTSSIAQRYALKSTSAWPAIGSGGVSRRSLHHARNGDNHECVDCGNITQARCLNYFRHQAGVIKPGDKQPGIDMECRRTKRNEMRENILYSRGPSIVNCACWADMFNRLGVRPRGKRHRGINRGGNIGRYHGKEVGRR